MTQPFDLMYSTPDALRNADIPFKHQPQMNALVDILSRKDRHHIVLISRMNPIIMSHFLSALVTHLSQDKIPSSIRNPELQYLSIEDDLTHILSSLNERDHCLLLHVDYKDLKSIPQIFFKHARCRLIIHLQPSERMIPDKWFTLLKLRNPTEEDIFAILKQQRTELEYFHHVIIPEELLHEAFELSKRFLNKENALTHALSLLDSAAARSKEAERVVTNKTLVEVLSHLTQIPSTHLRVGQFHFREFLQGMQQKIFGQENALAIIAESLQPTYLQLRTQTGPLAFFMFAGAKHSGKQCTAVALSELLFNHDHALYIALPLSDKTTSLATIRFQTKDDSQSQSLAQVLEETPYAILFFENMENASSSVWEDIQEICFTGSFEDRRGHRYDLQTAIIIFSSTVEINEVNHTPPLRLNQKDHQDVFNLLGANEERDAFFLDEVKIKKMTETIQAEIRQRFPQWFFETMTLVPFSPLTMTVYEKIFKEHLKILCQRLQGEHHIRLDFASEVIPFLAKSAKGNSERALEVLYQAIEQSLIGASHRRLSQQLYLQLNETGQMLRCDWLTTLGNR